MIDPLSEFITLLRPRTVFSKGISGAGRWGVRYSDFGQPSFCAVMEGSCRLAVDGHKPVTLEAGDFVLLPATPGFVLSGFEAVTPRRIDPNLMAAPGDDVRHGRAGGRPDVRLLGGYFVFDSPDAALLVSLLPALMHVRGEGRLAALVGMVREETGSRKAGRDLVLSRLVEVLLIEALRATQADGETSPGLLRGLADARIAAAIRQMHGDPARGWTVQQLARKAALSRSAFFDRFMRTVGLAPMEYLLAWRMAVAKDMLRRDTAIDDVARQVGYASASTFSTAFSRHVGLPPGRYARQTAASVHAL